MNLHQGFGLVVVLLAAWAIYRRLEVRLTLILAALALGSLAGDPWAVVQMFFGTFANERFVVPICSAMGFAYVMRHTGCDRHLVQLLVQPLKKVRFFLLPGAVVVGFLVNMPVVSQTSTAVTIGPVLIPILAAAGFRPITIGAALLLGSSIGGELLNPAAPELNTVIEKTVALAKEKGFDPTPFDKNLCVARILPLNLLGLAVGTLVFWFLALRHERRTTEPSMAEETPPDAAATFHVNPLKALIPLLPLILLYLNFLDLLVLPRSWLTGPNAPQGQYEVRLIGLAMLIGVAAAALAAPRQAGGVGTTFFEGAGYGFTHITSLIVAANCFGTAIDRIGLAALLKTFIQQNPALLMAAATVLPWAFAILCGSGMASTSSLYGFFTEPAFSLGIDPTHVGAVVSIGSAAGRTMSPVAAVTLMSGQLTKTDPLQLVRLIAWPLIAAFFAVFLAALLTLAPLSDLQVRKDAVQRELLPAPTVVP